MKKTLLIIIAFLALILESAFLFKMKGQRDVYRHDVEILSAETDTFRTRNNELAAKVSSLQLTKNDYEKIMKDDASEIKKLRKRNEYLEHAVKARTETELQVKTIIRDSTVYRDRIDTIRFFHWEDLPWEYIHGEMDGNNVSLDISHHEELDINIFLEYKKFLWWKIKLKGYNVDVVGKNPYTKDIKVNSVTIVK